MVSGLGVTPRAWRNRALLPWEESDHPNDQAEQDEGISDIGDDVERSG